MPLREYLCDSCGRTIEVIQGVSEPRLTICDRCGGPVKRLLSAPAVQFKGSGWYVSDYGKSGSAATESKKKEDGSPAASTSEKPSASSGSDSSGSVSSGSDSANSDSSSTGASGSSSDDKKP